jgi:diguanylate cyclase (GGDEF)-like protein
MCWWFDAGRTKKLRGSRPITSGMVRSSGTWLCPTELDRQRVIDNTGRVRRARLIGSCAVGATLLFFAPKMGWWTLVLFALSGVNMLTLDARTARSARPEHHVLASALWTQGLLSATVALSGGPHSLALPWIVIPSMFAAARFRPAVVRVVVVAAVGLMLVATLGVDARETLAHPDGIIVATALLLTVAAVVVATSTAELAQRTESTLDALTGLLNRSSLDRRFRELAEQAALADAPVSLVVCDIDHFKVINDEHGHARGDDVLRDLAGELRRQLRSFELVYRLGGEEFLILLPGTAAAEAVALAERLRVAVALRRPGGIDVTLSFGTASAGGDGVDLPALFARADAALYRAKAEGRNRTALAA